MTGEFIFRELGDEEIFDPLSISSAAPFTQSAEYGKWQKDLGRDVRRFLIKKGGDIQGSGEQNSEIFGFFQTIKYELPFGKSFVYSPYGPIVREVSHEFISEFKKYLLNIFGQEAVFIRLDFSFASNEDLRDQNRDQNNDGNKDEKAAKILSDSFKKPHKSTFHSAYLQPRAEWYLDITDHEENLLKRMHEKTRYLINLSARKGIQTEIIEKDFKNYLESFYSLLHETATRNGFSLHPKKYYEKIFEHIEGNLDAFLSVAKYEGKILVMNFIFKYGDVARFIFGGSSSEHRNISPSHAAHWAAIKHAKKIAGKSYNFGGVTTDATHEDWAGLSSFKKKFGGHLVLHDNCYDLVVKPTWYYLYISRKILYSIIKTAK